MLLRPAIAVLRYVSFILSSDKATLQILSFLHSIPLVLLGFALLLPSTGVFILAPLSNLPSFPNMGPWQYTRDLLHLLPNFSSSSPIEQVIYMYDVQSPRVCHRGWHLITLFLDSAQCLTSWTLILLSMDCQLTESAGHRREIRGQCGGGFYSPSWKITNTICTRVCLDTVRCSRFELFK